MYADYASIKFLKEIYEVVLNRMIIQVARQNYWLDKAL